ncbi:MAG: S8 family serine peptidase [Candidatus Xenobia bacterium]
MNVAVIDSGFQHPSKPLVAWEDVIDGSDQPIDPVGHGTHVAGDILQTAPDAGIVAIRVMNQDGQGRPSDIIRGIQYAIDHQKDLNIGVINMSLGGPNDGVSSQDDPIDRAVEQAIRHGIAVVDAAGNDGPKPSTVGSPADDPKGIAVGSALNPQQVSDFSSRGPTADGAAKPDITAPGEFIVSWNVPGSQLDKITTVVEKIRHMDDAQLVKLFQSKPQLIQAFGLPDDVLDRPDRDDVIKSKLPPMFKPTEDTLAGPGTSFASPLVAGVVADMEQANPNATPAQLKAALKSTASPMDSQFGPNDQGAGFVNAPAAINSIQSA